MKPTVAAPGRKDNGMSTDRVQAPVPGSIDEARRRAGMGIVRSAAVTSQAAPIHRGRS